MIIHSGNRFPAGQELEVRLHTCSGWKIKVFLDVSIASGNLQSSENPCQMGRNSSSFIHFNLKSLTLNSSSIPIGSMVLLYMVTWIPSIYPIHVSIYTSTMDPSWDLKMMFIHFHPFSLSLCQVWADPRPRSLAFCVDGTFRTLRNHISFSVMRCGTTNQGNEIDASIYIYIYVLERPFCTIWRLKIPSEFPLSLTFIYFLRSSKF